MEHRFWEYTVSTLLMRFAGRLPTFVRFLLGGSWVVISGVISPLIWVITILTLLMTPLITPQEPPSDQSYNQILGRKLR